VSVGASTLTTLFITQFFDPEPGAVRGLPLARWLTAHGHSVEVLTGFPNYPGGRVYPGYRMRLRQRETIEGISVLRVPLYPSHDMSTIGRVANYVSYAASASTIGLASVAKADVAYVYNPPTVAIPALVLKAVRDVSYIYHIGDMWPESVTESGMVGKGATRRVVETAIHALCNLVYRRAATITVLSPGFKRILIERGVPAEKIHVIYNWTDENVFRPVPRDEALAEELGFANRFNVLYAGNFGVFQGLDTVIRAAALLRDIPDLQIVLAGTGPQEAQLRDLVARQRANNVRFLNRRPFQQMPAINALADALLVHLQDLPFFSATIPSKTQVALASARPVVMAVRGDAADIVERARAGLTCIPADHVALAEAIERMHGLPPTERDAMGARGREFYLQNMSLDYGAGQMDRLCRRIVSP
jgi:glycosyltransferase involved in cell wall biosynthesis